MKVNFIYLFIAVLLFLGLGLYAIDLRQDIVRSQEEKHEIIQQKIGEERIKMVAIEDKKEKEIMVLEVQLTSLASKIESLELAKIALVERLQNEKLALEKEGVELREKVAGIEVLEIEIKRLQDDKTALEKVIKTLPTRLEKKLKDPTWAELKQFLRDDKTNEIVFDDKTFDCSGFAITLFRNARAHGIRTAYVEVVFGNYGHALNKFKTTDKGYVFIDVTGNKEGTGRDTVAYIKEGELFGTIYIGAVKSSKIDCARITPCSHFINPLPTKRHSKLFDYSFFQDKLVCGNLFDECLSELNDEIDRFNRQESHFSRQQIDSWRNNINLLGGQISVDRKFVFTEMPKKVTNVEVYW